MMLAEINITIHEKRVPLGSFKRIMLRSQELKRERVQDNRMVLFVMIR
jgi:hypothetical protein